jgi:putative Mg2+ transporter-C (MgtC) family protein
VIQGIRELFEALPPSLQIDVLGRLLLALVLGAAVGLERERSRKPAGLRTIILICVGAELFTEASVRAAGLTLTDLVRADPARIAAQIVTGIGFIGAGTILVYRGNVVGLTTAASMWVAAAIGMTVGLRAYVVAVGAAILVVLTLIVLGWIEGRFFPDRTLNTLRVTLEGPDVAPELVEESLAELGFQSSRLLLDRDGDRLTVGYRVSGTRAARDQLLERLFAEPRVRSAKVD